MCESDHKVHRKDPTQRVDSFENDTTHMYPAPSKPEWYHIRTLGL